MANFKTHSLGRTNTQAGLSMTSQALAPGNGERDDAPNIVILLTDGKPTPSLNHDLDSTVRYCRPIRMTIYTIIVILAPSCDRASTKLLA